MVEQRDEGRNFQIGYSETRPHSPLKLNTARNTPLDT